MNRTTSATTRPATSTTRPSPGSNRELARRSASTSIGSTAAHFFAGEDQHPATIFHEAIHQLFGESRKSVRNVGSLDNFWIIEGIATYFESLELHADGARYYTLGGPHAGRLPAARERLLSGDRYIPACRTGATRKGWLSGRGRSPHAVQSNRRADDLPDASRERPLSRCGGRLPRRRLFRPRPRKHARQTDRSEATPTSTARTGSGSRRCRQWPIKHGRSKTTHCCSPCERRRSFSSRLTKELLTYGLTRRRSSSVSFSSVRRRPAA